MSSLGRPGFAKCGPLCWEHCTVPSAWSFYTNQMGRETNFIFKPAWYAITSCRHPRSKIRSIYVVNDSCNTGQNSKSIKRTTKSAPTRNIYVGSAIRVIALSGAMAPQCREAIKFPSCVSSLCGYAMHMRSNGYSSALCQAVSKAMVSRPK